MRVVWFAKKYNRLSDLRNINEIRMGGGTRNREYGNIGMLQGLRSGKLHWRKREVEERLANDSKNDIREHFNDMKVSAYHRTS